MLTMSKTRDDFHLQKIKEARCLFDFDENKFRVSKLLRVKKLCHTRNSKHKLIALIIVLTVDGCQLIGNFPLDPRAGLREGNSEDQFSAPSLLLEYRLFNCYGWHHIDRPTLHGLQYMEIFR